MTALTHLTIADALQKLKNKEIKASELVQAHIVATEKARPLNAYITETLEQAVAAGIAADVAYANGTAGMLTGIPLANKDLFCSHGVRSTAASKILENFVPPYESTVSQKLLDAGAVFLGKANMDEFAMGSGNVNSAYGNVTNPWRATADRVDVKRVPGGSSGGSAAIVAARGAMAATASDTGGSIRQPAAFCGLVGMKPTYGRASRFGMIAFASSLDQAGILARTVADTALVLQEICGHDPKDSTSAPLPQPNLLAALTGDIRGLKVGIPKEYRPDGLHADIGKAWDQGIDWLKAAGAEVVEVSLPHTQHALSAYYIIAPAECSSNLARYDGMRYGLRVPGDNLGDTYASSRAAGFGKEVQRRIIIGTYVLSAGYFDAYYVQAQKIRAKIAQDFTAAFEKVDVLLTPTAPSTAFKIGEQQTDPITMYLNDIFTIPASLAGLPGISVPVGLGSDGLPIGLQILAKPFADEMVVKVAGVLEQAAQFTALPNFVV